MTVQRVIVIGASLGGIKALEIVLGALPAAFDASVAIVQHRGEDSSDSLLHLLARLADIEIIEADDKQPLVGGRVVVAPPGYHLMIDGDRFALSTEGLVHGARPSIDVLFQSAAQSFGAHSTAMALTSASVDGAEGAAEVESVGGLVLVQEPASAESSCLPRATIERCHNAQVVSLEGMVDRLVCEGAL